MPGVSGPMAGVSGCYMYALNAPFSEQEVWAVVKELAADQALMG